MNLCIDQGNSSTKIAVFDQNELIETASYEQFSFYQVEAISQRFPIDNCIFSSVVLENEELLRVLINKWSDLIVLSHSTPIPIDNQYKTPKTLGNDRVAAVVGASFLKPQTDILVIDAGTAITYDFIDANSIYWGGNIAAGLDIRLRAISEFTQKLPLVEAQLDSPILGNDTQSALLSGALYGIVFEIDGYINLLKIKYPQLLVFLTGGSIFYFETKLKYAIFAERNLVLIGLNRILRYNVQK